MTAELRAVRLKHAHALQRLLDSNPDYARRVGGGESAEEALTIRPPGTEASQKFDLGLWEGDELVAFSDVIRGWPSEEIAYIGLLMTHGERHRTGLGQRMHLAVLDLVAGWPEITTLRLAIVATNKDEAEPFWRRLGYLPTGDEKPYETESLKTVAHIWERPLRRGH